MAVATTRTLLPLDRWAQIIGVNPLHFSQVVTSAMPSSICGTPWKQFAWQEANQIGREDVAAAIAEAERRIAGYLGYTLLPDWVADERLPTTRPGLPELLNAGWRDLRGFRSQVQLSRGFYVAGGIEAKDLIDDNVTIVYTDADGDRYPETATITFNTAVTDICEIAIYYPGTDASDAWEIRPLRSVTIAAGVCTVVMYRQQLVLPELLEALVPTAVDGDDDANFLETVDAYRHWNDPQQQAEFLWSPLGCGWNGWDGYSCGSCSDSSCAACTAASQTGCLLGNDYRLGIVHFSPATWDAESSSFTQASYCMGRQPDRLRAWYYAGNQDTRQRCPTLQMDPGWERAVAYYAFTLLDREMCGCNNLEALANHYREDMALVESTPTGSRSYNLAQGLLGNPYGTQRGALVAWQKSQDDGMQVGKSVAW